MSIIIHSNNSSVNQAEVDKSVASSAYAAAFVISSHGILTNLIFILAVVTEKKFRSLTPYWLMLSLSVSDIGFLGVGWTQVIVNKYAQSSNGRPYFSTETWCRLFGALGVLFLDSNTLNMLLIATNRYLATIKLHKYKSLFTKKRSTIYIILLWSVSILVATTPIVFQPEYYIFIQGYSGCVSMPKSPFLIARFLMKSFVAFPYTVVIYTLVVKRLCTKKRRLENTLRATAVVTERYRRIAKRETVISLQFSIVVAFSAVSWLSFTVESLHTQVTGSDDQTLKVLYIISPISEIINASINPTVYYIFNRELRTSVHAMFRKICCKSSDADEVSNTNAASGDEENNNVDTTSGNLTLLDLRVVNTM